jgi:hypothetical protein
LDAIAISARVVAVVSSRVLGSFGAVAVVLADTLDAITISSGIVAVVSGGVLSSLGAVCVVLADALDTVAVSAGVIAVVSSRVLGSLRAVAVIFVNVAACVEISTGVVAVVSGRVLSSFRAIAVIVSSFAWLLSNEGSTAVGLVLVTTSISGVAAVRKTSSEATLTNIVGLERVSLADVLGALAVPSVLLAPVAVTSTAVLAVMIRDDTIRLVSSVRTRGALAGVALVARLILSLNTVETVEATELGITITETTLSTDVTKILGLSTFVVIKLGDSLDVTEVSVAT